MVPSGEYLNDLGATDSCTSRSLTPVSAEQPPISPSIPKVSARGGERKDAMRFNRYFISLQYVFFHDITHMMEITIRLPKSFGMLEGLSYCIGRCSDEFGPPRTVTIRLNTPPIIVIRDHSACIPRASESCVTSIPNLQVWSCLMPVSSVMPSQAIVIIGGGRATEHHLC